MQYKSYGTRYSEQYLRSLARYIYADVRGKPVSTEALVRGQPLNIPGPGTINVKVTMNTKSDGPDVRVEDSDFNVVEVTLPLQKHWQAQYGVVEPPPWLEHVFRARPDWTDLNSIVSISASFLTLKHLARVFGRDIPSLVSQIFEAEKEGASLSQQILAKSIEKSDIGPEQWLVDIRGYLLSVLADELIPN